MPDSAPPDLTSGRDADTPSQTDRSIRDLLEGIDAGAILLRPIFDNRDRIVDAEIEWANSRSLSMWFNTHGLVVGARVRDIYFDADDWLGDANRAWLGTTVRRWIAGDPTVAPWTRALEILRRVGDRLAELTVDRSSDQDVIDSAIAIEKKYRSILDHLPLVVISSFAGRGHLEYINPYAADLTGLPLEELRSIAKWADIIHPDDVGRLGDVRHAVFASGEWSGRVRLVRPDGVIRHADVRIKGHQTPDSVERRFVLTLLDVTDQVDAEERAQQTAQLVSLTRASGAFAHEFNNLLQLIAGHLEAAATTDPEGHVAAARNATDRATALVSGLVAFASGRPAAHGSVSVAEVCALTRTWFPADGGTSIDLTLSIPDRLPFAVADEDVLVQILTHLANNAVEAMPDGGSIRIDVDEVTLARCHMAHPTDNRCWVRIQVSDTGRGIAPERLAHVWEPFHSTKQGSQARGAGLGLSTVHGLVHQFDGHVSINSSEWTGTTVTVSLPGIHP